jgi:type I restriction enzyme S subunit
VESDLLIAMTGAEVGKIGIVPYTSNTLFLNQRVGSFKEKVNFSKWFSYFILSTDEYQSIINSSASGSAQPNISATQIENIELLLPCNDLIEMFGNYVNVLIQKILYNTQQIQTLTKLRDSLLPKLISGKILV